MAKLSFPKEPKPSKGQGIMHLLAPKGPKISKPPSIAKSPKMGKMK